MGGAPDLAGNVNYFRYASQYQRFFGRNQLRKSNLFFVADNLRVEIQEHRESLILLYGIYNDSIKASENSS
jgi:hypothetical protein